MKDGWQLLFHLLKTDDLIEYLPSQVYFVCGRRKEFSAQVEGADSLSLLTNFSRLLHAFASISFQEKIVVSLYSHLLLCHNNYFRHSIVVLGMHSERHNSQLFSFCSSKSKHANNAHYLPEAFMMTLSRLLC